MNNRFTLLCSISLLLGISGTADAQTRTGAPGFENDSVIVSGGPGSGATVGAPLAPPAVGSLAITNPPGLAPSLSLTNTNRFRTRFGAQPSPGLGVGGVVGGSRIVPPIGADTTVTQGTTTGSGVGPDTTIGGAAGVDNRGIGVGGGTPGIGTGSGIRPQGSVGGLGTGSSGTGTGARGVGGLGTGSSGIGTGRTGVGGLGTGSGGVGAGAGTGAGASGTGTSGTGR